MKKIFILLVFITKIVFAQDTCESKEETFEELNSITKCSIEPAKESDKTATRLISVKISASKKRYLKRRVHRTKEVANGINNNLSTKGLSKTESSSEILNSIELKKQNYNINALSNNLSKEEIKKAIKLTEASSIPKFTNCEDVNSKGDLTCFNKEMAKHIEKHFSYPSEAVINKLEGKVWVRFIINKNGNVTNIKTLGPKGAEILDDEAKRVVSKLPKFIPAKSKGENIPVKYGFPISFSLEN